MATELKLPEKPPTDQQQWELALAYLRRAEMSGHVLRAVVFLSAAGLFAFAFPQIRIGQPMSLLAAHVGPVLLCVLAVLCLFKSFRLQREKAFDRYNYLKSRNYDAFAQYNGALEQLSRRHSAYWDRLAAWLLVIVFLIELAVKFLPSAPLVNV